MIGIANSSGVVHLLLGPEMETWRDCVQHCQATDSVVLLDAGVMGLMARDGIPVRDFPCSVLVSRPDFEARIGPAAELGRDVDVISDQAFVELVEAHQHCVSWR